ncbi:hypothetical protein SprV_0100453200 [Sparganum proliferum]
MPHDLAIESATRRLQDNSTSIPMQHVSEMLRLCLNNYCQFDEKFYQQVRGRPMGLPISGLLAELVLQQREEEIMRTFKSKMWFRYVDGTFVIMKTCEIGQLHLSLNSVFPAIQFTREEATGGILPFLDVSIQTLSDDGLAMSVYRKDSSADVILNYESNLPAAHKWGCVRTLFHRAYRYCSSDDQLEKELAFLYRLFRLNGYPANFEKIVSHIGDNHRALVLMEDQNYGNSTLYPTCRAFPKRSPDN